MRVRRRYLIAILVLGALGALAAYVLLRGTAVLVVLPERSAVKQTVVSSGRVLPPAEIKIGALVTATVREVFVEEGDLVEVGDKLINLDDAEITASLAQAKAALGQAEAGRYEIAKLSAPEAQANLRRADANLAQAKNRLATSESLYGAGAGSRGEVDDARTALSVAQAQRDAAQLQLKATSSSGSRSAVAAAAVATAKAQIAVVEAQLARTRIVSPVAGIVLTRDLEPGDAVVAGSRMLLLARRGETRLVIEPDERNLALLAPEQVATASAEAFPKQQFGGVVRYIAPAVDPQRGTVEVHLFVADPPAYLRPHMTVSVEVEVSQRGDALVLPRQTIRDLASKQPHVLVVMKGRVQRVDVELGIIGDDRVEILAGVDEATPVIASPPSSMEVGDRVRVASGGE